MLTIEPPIEEDDTTIPEFIVWHPRIGVKIFDDKDLAQEYCEECGGALYTYGMGITSSNRAIEAENDKIGEREGKFPKGPDGSMKEVDSFVLNLFNDMKEEETLTLSTEFLAYTQQFELFYQEVQCVYPDVSRRWVYRKLCGLRKKGLGKTRLKRSTDGVAVEGEDGSLKMTPAQARILKALVRDQDSGGNGLDRREIAVTADVPYTASGMNALLGPKYLADADDVESKIGKRTLRGMGYVGAETEEDGRVAYYPTDQGRLALKEYLEEKGKKLG